MDNLLLYCSTEVHLQLSPMDSSLSQQLLPEDPCPAKIARESPLSELEMSTGEGKEQVKKVDDVKLDVAIDTENEHLLVEIKREYDAGARMTTENMFPQQDPVYEYARSIVERAKGKCALYRVHSGLRDVSAKHYEPVLVSIGPYHHRGKTQFQDMEEHKEHYLQVLLRRVMENNYESYVDAFKNEKGEPQALHCYRDSHQIMKQQDSFGKCMVRDGCFIIELLRRSVNRTEYEDFSNDKLFNMGWMLPGITCDMILFENQIPLFVLRALFAFTEKRPDTDRDFLKLALGFFDFNGEPITANEIETGRPDDIPHLLGLVYEALAVSKRKANLEQKTPKQQISRRSKSLLLAYLINIWSRFVRIMKALWSRFVRIIKALAPGTPEQPNYNRRPKSLKPIRTAVALKQVGVRFVKANDNAPFHDIGFSGGELSIPPLVIYDDTECLFRNLVAYEQYSKNGRLHRVMDYLYVMDCLINSSKDVELLCHYGIIDNVVGDGEKVSTMFNHLFTNVCFHSDDFSYTDMFNDVNEFCKNPWSVWIAKLKAEYFSSPWSVISLLAAVLLLLLTATQTMYAVLSYHHPKS